nr:trypsin-like peptidase domain-containing protein [Nocardioides ungokensis]
MNRTTRSLVRRTVASGAVLAAASLTLAGPAFADGPATTPSSSPGTATEATPVQVAPLVQPSVVYETVSWSGYVYDRFNGQYLQNKPFRVTMQCTGFVVNPDGYVATAGHCVDPEGGKDAIRRVAAQWALQHYYNTPGALTVDDVLGDYRVDILGDGNQVLHNRVDREVGVSWGASVSGVKVQKQKPARVLAFQQYDEGDGALLKVDETDLNAIELADTSGVEINSGAVAIGYPAIIDSFTDPDLTPTFDAGNVSSIKTVAHGLLSVFQLSAQLSGGMSGGPTVDAEGHVIGVNSSHFVGEPFNYAVPAERIKELLDSAGVDNTVSQTTETYRDGIRAYFEGDRTTAVADLSKVLRDQPANGLAETYLGKARDLPAPEPADSGTAWACGRPSRPAWSPRSEGPDRPGAPGAPPAPAPVAEHRDGHPARSGSPARSGRPGLGTRARGPYGPHGVLPRRGSGLRAPRPGAPGPGRRRRHGHRGHPGVLPVVRALARGRGALLRLVRRGPCVTGSTASRPKGPGPDGPGPSGVSRGAPRGRRSPPSAWRCAWERLPPEVRRHEHPGDHHEDQSQHQRPDAGQEDAADLPVRCERQLPRRGRVGVGTDLPVVVGGLDERTEQDQPTEERDHAPHQEVADGAGQCVPVEDGSREAGHPVVEGDQQPDRRDRVCEHVPAERGEPDVEGDRRQAHADRRPGRRHEAVADTGEPARDRPVGRHRQGRARGGQDRGEGGGRGRAEDHEDEQVDGEAADRAAAEHGPAEHREDVVALFGLPRPIPAVPTPAYACVAVVTTT